MHFVSEVSGPSLIVGQTHFRQAAILNLKVRTDLGDRGAARIAKDIGHFAKVAHADEIRTCTENPRRIDRRTRHVLAPRGTSLSEETIIATIASSVHHFPLFLEEEQRCPQATKAVNHFIRMYDIAASTEMARNRLHCALYVREQERRRQASLVLADIVLHDPLQGIRVQSRCGTHTRARASHALFWIQHIQLITPMMVY
ncbi:hypothetical protein PsorP6_017480 [Peronosclerospora sorghi]|uniref:Uncharacterized protein n=1 Tax=Peronosclerospora sorghi TaxID=230839 RepID=A0ACC0WNE9_9STRA|nr:hypothetical protein PsorP6_017480 [Peronosclerospora sorghi]